MTYAHITDLNIYPNGEDTFQCTVIANLTGHEERPLEYQLPIVRLEVCIQVDHLKADVPCYDYMNIVLRVNGDRFVDVYSADCLPSPLFGHVETLRRAGVAALEILKTYGKGC